MTLLKPIGLGLLLLGISLGTFSRAADGGNGNDLEPVACGQASVVTDTDIFAGGVLPVYSVIFAGPNPEDDSEIQAMWDERFDILLQLLEMWVPDGLCFVPPDTCKADEECLPILEEWGIFWIEGPELLPDGTASWTLYFEGLFGWRCTQCIKKIV